MLLAGLTFWAGCATNATLLNESTRESRKDVFIQVNDSKPPHPQWSDLDLVASLKTHDVRGLAGKDVHGTPDYRLLVHIEGQSLLLEGTRQTERLDREDVSNPESGEGIRYRFASRLRLKPGHHRVIVSLPGDGVAVAGELDLAAGETGTLQITPEYNVPVSSARPRFQKMPRFSEGIKALRLTWNNKPL